MSYILDALKKSEQQRPPGRGPELFAVHGPLPPRRFPWLPLAVAGLVAGAVALGIWIGYASRGPAAQPVAVPAVPVEARSVPPSAPPAVASPPHIEPARPLAAPRTPAKRAGAGTAPHTALSAAAPPVQVPAVPPTTVPDSPPTAGAAPTPSPVAAPAASPAPAAPTPAEAATAAPAPAASAAPLTVEQEPGRQEIPGAPQLPEIPPPDGRILDLAELPASVRGEVGAVGLTGHVWSEEPSLRLVTVEDRMLREGGGAPPGTAPRGDHAGRGGPRVSGGGASGSGVGP